MTPEQIKRLRAMLSSCGVSQHVIDATIHHMMGSQS
jgi:hypothetical protein